MILDYCIHPDTRTHYRFPRKQMRLSATGGRKNPVFVVPGGGGPINPRGLAPFDRDVNILTYSFRFTPYADGTLPDTLYDAFLVAVDHGKPQTLTFLEDSGRLWFVQAVLARKPYNVDGNGRYQLDVSADWVLLSDFLEAPAPGAAIFGHYFKFGHHAKFGSGGVNFALTSNPAPAITVDNRGVGATAPTLDPTLRLIGPYGPASPSSLNKITIAFAPSGKALTIQDNCATADDRIDIDLKARRVLKNGSPAFGILGRPDGQQGYAELLPEVANTITVSYVGGDVAPPNGVFRLRWNPKRGL